MSRELCQLSYRSVFGNRGRNRTFDLIGMNYLLYQLSYTVMGGIERFELSSKVLEALILPLNYTPMG